MLKDVTEVADDRGWHSYRRDPPISVGEWEEERSELRDGVTLVLTRQEDSRYTDLSLIQACVRRTASESDAAGFYMGRACVEEKK